MSAETTPDNRIKQPPVDRINILLNGTTSDLLNEDFQRYMLFDPENRIQEVWVRKLVLGEPRAELNPVEQRRVDEDTRRIVIIEKDGESESGKVWHTGIAQSSPPKVTEVATYLSGLTDVAVYDVYEDLQEVVVDTLYSAQESVHQKSK